MPCAGLNLSITLTRRAGLLGAAGLVVLIGTVGFRWDLRRRRRAAAARNGGNVRDLIPAAPSGVWRGAQTDKPGGARHGTIRLATHGEPSAAFV